MARPLFGCGGAARRMRACVRGVFLLKKMSIFYLFTKK